MPVLAADDVNLYYEEHGDGVPLLLVAGLASDSQSWQPVVAALARQCRVILVDNRGSGTTTPLDVRTSIGAMAEGGRTRRGRKPCDMVSQSLLLVVLGRFLFNDPGVVDAAVRFAIDYPYPQPPVPFATR